MSEKINAFKIHKQWTECEKGKKNCPFCNNPRKSKWYYDGTTFVVADDAEKPNTLILFPHMHYPQWVLIGSNHQIRVENIIRAVADAIWGRNTKVEIDWEAKTYEHAHVQLTRLN